MGSVLFSATLIKPRPAMVSSTGSASGISSWGQYRLSREEPFRMHLGETSVVVRTAADELRVVSFQEPAGPGTSPEPTSSDPTWTRWAASSTPLEIRVTPQLPDRPVVLQPAESFHLLPGARARIYVRVPVWIRIEVTGSAGGVLTEVPTLVLSDTWWGDFASGEVCYWLPIVARRSASQEIFLPERIICPLELVNRANETLPVEKILLRCEHLTVFRGSGSLWSDEIRVRYRGEEVGSDVEMTGRPPPEAEQARRLTVPREPMVKGITARTFARLRGLSGF
jgi:hypothetical protein